MARGRFGEWVAHVTHDSEDGFWQFRSLSGFGDEPDAVLISLAEIVNTNSTLMQLADLPHGWHAWRDAPGALWQREAMDKGQRKSEPDWDKRL